MWPRRVESGRWIPAGRVVFTHIVAPTRAILDVRKQIDLDLHSPPVVVSGRVLNELCAHALETQPEECCGLLAGNGSERFASVLRCRNEMTRKHRGDPASFPRDGREAYYMNEIDFLRSQEQVEQRGEVLTAVYHSHVGAGAYFSELDQEFAEHDFFPLPEAAHVVVAVWDRRVSQVGVFERAFDNGPLTGRLLQAREP